MPVGEIILASATFLAVLVALFQEPLRARFSRAKLAIELRKSPPDTHQIDLVLQRPDGLWERVPSIYARIRVRHVAGAAAENAEVMAAEVWRIENGNRRRVDTFLPMSLRWSHFQPPTTTIRVPKGGFRHCDLGHFVSTQFVGSLNPGLQLPPGGSRFWLDTIVQPNAVAGSDVPNMLDPGEYEIELRLIGDNVKPLTTRCRVSFEAEWSDDESMMLGRIELALT